MEIKIFGGFALNDTFHIAAIDEEQYNILRDNWRTAKINNVPIQPMLFGKTKDVPSVDERSLKQILGVKTVKVRLTHLPSEREVYPIYTCKDGKIIVRKEAQTEHNEHNVHAHACFEYALRALRTYTQLRFTHIVVYVKSDNPAVSP